MNRSKYESKKMDTLLVQLIFIIIGFVAVAFVASLFLKKKKDNYVPESDVINDSDYNIENVETKDQSGESGQKEEVS